MKAIVQTGYGSPDLLELRDVEKPAAGEGRVLVRVRAASVNALDWHMLKRLPHLIGRLMGMPTTRIRGADLAGVVEAIGDKVTGLQPGDEVFGTGIGAFAEYASSSEERLAPKPRNLGFEQAAAIPVAGCTALQGLRDTGRLTPGQRVIVYGAGGGVGTFAVQIAKSLGAHVTAVTRPANLDFVRSLGADVAVDYTTEDFTRRPELYDVIFDVGANRSFADMRRVLAPSGRVVGAGAPKSMAKAVGSFLWAQLVPRGSRRQAAVMARIRRKDLTILGELAETGKLAPAIDRTYALSEVPEAMRYFGTGAVRGKVVIRVA